jgi:hypothetical protein
VSDSSRSGDDIDTTAYHGGSEVKTSPIYREIQHGPAKTILGVVDGDGICESHDYLAALNKSDQAQFKARFERYVQIGFLRSPNEMRIIEETDQVIRIHEIKTRNGHRLFGVQEDLRFVATHGTRKPKPREVTKHAARARSVYEAARSREEAEKEK